MNKSKLKSNEASVAVTTEASDQTQSTRKGNDMDDSTTTVTASNVPSMTFNGMPVITTNLLAQLYNTTSVRIRQNYTKNKQRFEEGKHCFKIEGSELKDFKNKVALSDSVGIGLNAKSIVLYTERGAARHAKMLETDKAWDVFEELEDHYFSNKIASNETINALPSPLTPAHQLGIQKEIGVRVYEKVKDESKRPRAFKAIYRYLKNRFDVGSYKDIPDRDYTQALAAVRSAPLEGEWLKSTTPRLEIHYPVSEWRQQNPQFEQFQHNLPSNQLRINHHMLLREDAPIQSSSPTVALLNQLQDEGHNVDACVAEVNGLFMAAANMDTFLKGVKHGIKSILCESSTITYSR